MWVLGSSSPRRQEILSAFSIPFSCHSPSFDESSVIFEKDPVDYCENIAKGKALSLAEKHAESPLLTADTVVYQRGRVFGKPKDKEQAEAYLSVLSGSSHSVFTSLCVLIEGKLSLFTEESKVYFQKLSKNQIAFYLAHVPWQDKAGAYMAQLPGGMIVKKIEGCFYNVMGLPLFSLEKALNLKGDSLWQATSATL